AVATLRGHRATVNQLAFSPDGGRLASAGRDRVGFLWDVATGTPLATLDGHRGAVRAVAFSPDGRTVATRGTGKRILVYDAPPPGGKLTEFRERIVLEGHRGAVACLAFSPDGRLLASGSDAATKTGGGEVKVWDAATGAAVAGWADHAGDITAV